MKWDAQQKKHCFQVHPSDNVATLLDDVQEEQLTINGHSPDRVISALEIIPYGHKIALASISQGDPIIKYGVPIALATKDIHPGEWVHLHNCRSQVDQRSAHLDIKTGAAKDTPYA